MQLGCRPSCSGWFRPVSSGLTDFHQCPRHQIPRSYLTLQEAVLAEKQRRDAKGEVKYLTDAQLDSIIEQNPGSDIRDYEDLQTGTVTCSNTSNMKMIW